MNWRTPVAALAVAVLVLSGCASTVTGSPTWPGARLDKALLTAVDFPPDAQFDRIVREPGEGDGGLGAPPAMLSKPKGCSDGLTRDIADSAERGPGSAAEYVVGYDGARVVMTVLTWQLDLEQLAATAQRCAQFEVFFDPASPGIPMTTTRIDTARPDALVYRQTMRLGDVDNDVYFAFENVGSMAVYGIALPVPYPTIAAKGALPQTFLDIMAKQAERAGTV